MTAPNISNLPTAPSRSDPATFSDRADGFMAALPTMSAEMNALATWMQALAVLADGGSHEAQTSLTDTTMGRLQKVGAWGWGLHDAILPETNNLDTWKTNGLIRFSSGTSGIPGGSSAGVVLHITRLTGEGGGRAMQTAWSHSGNIYTRVRATTGWETWVQMVQQGFEPSFPSLNLNGNLIGGEQITIADDAVGVITLPRTGGFALITASGEDNYPNKFASAFIYFDVGVSLDVEIIWQTGSSTSVASTSDVTGTTGADGLATLAVQADVLKIENRLGVTRTFQITAL